MADSTLWWLLAGVAVAIELATGTFYLLMLSLGFAVAAVSAYLKIPFTLQLGLAAAVGAGSVLALRRYRANRPQTPVASANRDVNLDIGETVHVDNWSADGTTTVKYRGANWAVSCAQGQALFPGPHRVVEVVGNRLVVQPV